MAVKVEAVPESTATDSARAGIELRKVVKRYGNNNALRELDLHIHDGEFFCLLGPSGCGKTTTLNLIGGFVAPTAGTIWLRGKRIDTLPPHKRQADRSRSRSRVNPPSCSRTTSSYSP